MSKTPVGKKDLSSKLAGAVRAAKTEHVAEEVQLTKSSVARPRARQSSPDDQQHQLHPERIWPD